MEKFTQICVSFYIEATAWLLIDVSEGYSNYRKMSQGITWASLNNWVPYPKAFLDGDKE